MKDGISGHCIHTLVENNRLDPYLALQGDAVGTFNSPSDEEEPVFVAFAQVARVQPALGIQSLLRLVGHVEVTHEDVAAPEADLTVPVLVWVVQLRLASWDLFTAAAAQNTVGFYFFFFFKRKQIHRQTTEAQTGAYLVSLKASGREMVCGPVLSLMPYSSYRGMSRLRKNSRVSLVMGAAPV